MSRKTSLLLALTALSITILACGSESDAQVTSQALSTAIAETAIAGAKESGPSDEVLTAQAEATEKANNIQATQTANAMVNDEEVAATETVASPIKAQLPIFGVDPEKGQVAWTHAPITLDVSDYQDFDYANDHPGTVAVDFVLSSDITWNTQYGTSGCGYMFRSDGDQEKPSQYMALITRAGTGHVVFLILNQGDVAAGYDFYPRTENPGFDFHNDGTNQLTIVGRGALFDIYTNGIWIGQVDVTQPPKQPIIPPPPPLPADQTDANAMEQYRQAQEEYQQEVAQIQGNFQARLNQYHEGIPLLERGFLAFTTLSESGRTICQFDNAWLWLIEE